jgi:hypothetical protein
MTDLNHCYRVRAGDYRIIYQIRNKELIILVLTVADRKEVYKIGIAELKKLISSMGNELK